MNDKRFESFKQIDIVIKLIIMLIEMKKISIFNFRLISQSISGWPCFSLSTKKKKINIYHICFIDNSTFNIVWSDRKRVRERKKKRTLKSACDFYWPKIKAAIHIFPARIL